MQFRGNIIPSIELKELQAACTTVAIETLGCKLNQAETETISRQLRESGYLLVSPEDKADIYILNTCTVTHVADRKARHLLRMAHRKNPLAKIIVTGCYAQRAGRELSDIEGITLVVDNFQKTHLRELLDDLTGFRRHNETVISSDKLNRTRSYIKAQDGCNNFCTYCIVPLVRGREISLPPEQVVDQIKLRVNEGYQEVVLTGTEIGKYRHDTIDLTQLLKRILNETGIARLRLSSLQPQEFSIELLRIWENARMCRHFHLSLQSGSDSVLSRMKRRYSVKNFEDTVRLIRSEIPEVAITTDIIVGFPGETQAEFDESYSNCRMLGFARIHVFPYSPRHGTGAAQMTAQVEPRLKKQRMETMLLLAKTSLCDFNSGFLDSTMPVLFEQKSGNQWSGLTDNYIKVYAKSKEPLANHFFPVKLVKLVEDGVQGLIEQSS